MHSNSGRGVWTAILGLFSAICLVLLLLAISLAQTPSTPANPAPVGGSPPSSSQVQPRPVVMLDPAHGGTESGAVLNPTLLEKDVTLALARRLQQDLTSRGIVSELVRDADVNLSTDDRAAKANAEHVVLYLCLHASSEVGGIRIFSAMMPQTEISGGPFLDWNTAQAGSISKATSIQQQLVAAIQKSGLPVRELTAPLRPLNNVVAPAIAVEVGPTSANVTQLMSSDFQAAISAALTNGLVASVPELGQGAPR